MSTRKSRFVGSYTKKCMEGFSHEATLAMPEETYKINIEGTIIVHYGIIPLEFWEGSIAGPIVSIL